MMMQRIKQKSFEKLNRFPINGVLPVIIGLLLFPQILFAGEIEDLFNTTKTTYAALDKTLAADLITIESQIEVQMPLVKTDITNAGEALTTDISTITKPVKDISDTVFTDAIAELKTKIDDANTKLTTANTLKAGTVKTALATAKAALDMANDTCNIDVTQFDITDTIVEVYENKKSEVQMTLSFLGKTVSLEKMEWQFDKSKDNIDTVVEKIKKSDPFKIPTVVIP